MSRSAAERHSTSLNSSFEVSTVAMSRVSRRSSRCAREQAAQERHRPDRSIASRQLDQQEDRPRFVRRERRSGRSRCARSSSFGLRIEGQRRAPPRIVQPLVAQQHLILAVDHAMRESRRAARGARRAPRTDRRNHCRSAARATPRRALVRGCAPRCADRRCPPQEDRARDMDDVLLQHDLARRHR